MPVITVGPGKLAHAHSSQEQVALDDVLQAAKLYAFTAMDWCGIV